MKEITRKLALVLTVCMVLNTVIPAYADEIVIPEEPVMQQEVSDIEVSEIIHDAEPEEEKVLVGKEPEIEDETDDFPYYVVKFTYEPLKYTLVGNSTKLSYILSAFNILGTPSDASVSDTTLLTVTKDADEKDWTVNVLSEFSSAELNVTVEDDQTYVISVANDLNDLITKTATYIDVNGVEHTVENCIVMKSDNPVYDYTIGYSQWYIVEGTFTIKHRVSVKGMAHVILGNGAVLNVPRGIQNPSGSQLHIYAQSKEAEGMLIAEAESNCAAIGGDGNSCDAGDLYVYGGVINATGGFKGAGIGGGCMKNAMDYPGGSGGNIHIGAGKVTASGGAYAAGIGCGSRSSKLFHFSIDGGEAEATGGALADGIGGGYNSKPDYRIDINNELEIVAGASKESSSYKTNEEFPSFRCSYVNIHAVPSYTVNHFMQKADGTGYSVAESETFKGHTGEKTEAAFKAYKGFIPLNFEQQKIKSDGSTAVDINYDRLSYTMVFDTNEHGRAPAAVNALYGAPVEEPAAPEARGYIFDGWYEEAACTTPYAFTTMPLGGKTVYAKWIPDAGSQYTIIWKDWNGTVLATSKVVENGLPKYPGASRPSRNGYIFTGWTPEIDLATADTTYTATYEVKSSGGGGGGSGSGKSSQVIAAYAEKQAVTPITVAANGSQMMGTAVVSIPAAQIAASGIAPVPGIWNKANGLWTFTKADGNKAKNEWILITVAGGNASYFYFDLNANMVTGWQQVGGKWMYFNDESGSLLGACLMGPGRTPDGYEINASGAWTGR